MIIPVRCFTCGKVLADKWNFYSENLKKNIQDENDIKSTKEDLAFKKSNGADVLLKKLGLNRLCCRRHMLGHVDLIEII
jgi:DNA-directed RNA polymerase I, II, and III subunit RPABC5